MEVRWDAQTLDYIPDIVALCAWNGTIHITNRSWTELLGYLPDQLHDRSLFGFIAPEDLPGFLEVIRSLESNSIKKAYVEVRFHRKSDGFLWIACSLNRISDSLFVVDGKDISERRSWDHVLREVETTAEIGGWSLISEGYQVRWSHGTYRLHEIPFGAPVTFARAVSFYVARDQERLVETLEHSLKFGTSFDCDFQHISSTGKASWVRVTGHPSRDEHGRVIGLQGTFQDVTNRRQMYEESEKRRAQLEALIANSPGIAFQLRSKAETGKWIFDFIFDTVEDLLGVTARELQLDARLFFEAFAPGERFALESAISSSIEASAPFEWTGRASTRGGRKKSIQIRARPRTAVESETVWDGVLFDVSKEHELQEALLAQKRHSEFLNRLAAIGELAAGVGHEIANPLTIAMGNVEKAKRLLKEHPLQSNEILQSSLLRTDDALARIQKTIDALRNFSRIDNAIESGTCFVCAAIQNVISLVKEACRSDGIDLLFEGLEPDLQIAGDSGRVQQVIMNLISNAREAVSGRPSPRVEIGVALSGPQVEVRIRDNGRGIPAEHLERIFHTFYTTKSVGQGTGLGLSISHQIVKSIGGSIRVNSRVNEGTEFVLNFRVAPFENDILRMKLNSGEAVHALVVEDEDYLREIIVDELKELGMKVEQAADGHQALECIRNAATPFNIVISDHRMSGMNGIQLFKVLASDSSQSQMFRILMTGGSESDVATAAQEAGATVDMFHATIAKPFESETLRKVLKNLLARKSS